MSCRISVIVPVLNEAHRLDGTLRRLRLLTGVHEVIVVDGGSRDHSMDIARDAGADRVVSCQPGRAWQMNQGAAHAKGNVLLFLHADVQLPADAALWIVRAFQNESVVAGAFRTWTVCEKNGPPYAPLLHLADMRSRYTRHPYGDQALFVRAKVFAKVGGFPEQPLLEDLELSRRLRRQGKIYRVPASVRVSGRRFLARPIYYTLALNLIPLAYRLGVPATTLSRLYRPVS